jgi:glucose-1-phosphate thymidylyltransferase
MGTDVVGLIPAGGLASRLGRIPCSKEILPVMYRSGANADARPATACELLIQKFRDAGVRRVFIVLRDGKWDIPAYLGAGERFDVDIAYLMMTHPFGQPFTLDAAYPFVRESTVLVGCPDILFACDDAFGQLVNRKDTFGADVVLGLFPVRRPEKMDMVRIGEGGGVEGLVIKPLQTRLTHTWLIAAWSSTFTEFLHDHVAGRLRDRAVEHPSGREIYLGDVFQAALDAGLSFDTVRFADTDYIDIGTPDDLCHAVTGGFPTPASGGDGATT